MKTIRFFFFGILEIEMDVRGPTIFLILLGLWIILNRRGSRWKVFGPLCFSYPLNLHRKSRGETRVKVFFFFYRTFDNRSNLFGKKQKQKNETGKNENENIWKVTEGIEFRPRAMTSFGWGLIVVAFVDADTRMSARQYKKYNKKIYKKIYYFGH